MLHLPQQKKRNDISIKDQKRENKTKNKKKAKDQCIFSHNYILHNNT